MKKNVISIAIMLSYFMFCCDDEIISIKDKITFENIRIECQVLPAGAYNAIQFTSQNTGYTISNNGKIYKTEDGGKTWLSQSSNTEMPLNELFFLDSKNGYVTGFNGVTNEGIILKTTNGGNTWELYTFQEQIHSIYFIDNMTGFATGQKLYKTVNGGETWSEIDLGYSAYGSINFYDDKINGFLVAGNLTTGYSVLRTSDGGGSWNVTDNEWGDSSIGGIQILNKIDLAFISSQGGKIFKTRDKGNKWQIINSAYSGHFINEQQAVGVGQYWPELGFFPYGILLITNDGGKNWEQKTFSDFYSVLDIDFSNDSTAIAVGQTNGGCIIHLEF